LHRPVDLKTIAMPYLAFLLLLFAIILFWQSNRQRRRAGLPGGRVIYSDTRGWGEVEKPLYAPDIGLTGKPDYLVEKNGLLIPIEVKSGRAPNAPYDSHIYQLAAYCMLVDKVYKKRPPYGIIHYADRDFAVDYTQEMESALNELMLELQRDEYRTDVPRSHEKRDRCQRCGYRNICDDRLR